MTAGLKIDFLHGEQEFGDHVPVNAAEALKGEHGAAAAGERPVVEDFLPQSRDGFAVRGDGFLIAGFGNEPVKSRLQVADVGEFRMEMGAAMVIDSDEAAVAREDERGKPGNAFCPISGQCVALQK
ncbi:MAG: hypothetical protein MUC40_04570 [Akkermansiaceae bacterium]|nr:hypothetical protein [Akkermansiaceae bacterium]